MKLILPLLGMTMSVMVATAVFPKQANAQLLNVKPWHGYYPEMNDNYPLSFVAFKGWLIPKPHVFVRTWPTHYYVELGALPVSDAEAYAGETKTGLLRIVARLLEQSKMKSRSEETTRIKSNKELEQAIEQRLFQARSDELPDIYGLANRFIRLYDKIRQLEQVEQTTPIKKILQQEADDLLLRFLMVNLLQTDHGEKVEAFAMIHAELTKLSGETDYTFQKVSHFNRYGNDQVHPYAFLSR
ncbi:hypothetical protein [uncultured Sunxiuqinia sp.]|uniref:hypothetical protein n=1 Tax=uncultured Sunxiuqinia sp. TaxID=1573825 RepID=UPI0030DAA526